MKQPLAIVGASTRAAAASAVRAGFQPLAADLFADADLRQIATATRIRPYPDGLLDWLRAVEPQAWMYTGALENHADLVDQMAWIAPLLGNPGDVLARVRSPWELAHVLQNAGLLFPEMRRSSDGLPRDGTWLAKSYRGASGSGVREFGGARDDFTEWSAPIAYQRRVDGLSCAAVYVAADGAAKLLGVTRQLVGEPWLGAGTFQYGGSIGPLHLSAAARAAVERVGNVLSENFELMGLFGVDFIVNGDEVWLIEVNPRYTASVEIVERCTGVRAIVEHVAVCVGGRILAESESPSAKNELGAAFHGKAILYARQDVVISSKFADYCIGESMCFPWPMLADVSPAGTPIETGRPVLTVFAEGPSAGDVEARLRARVTELERMLYAER